MSKMQRDKGARIERLIVGDHKKRDINTERVPLSGASHYQGGGHDIDVYPNREDLRGPLVCEVKARKDGFKFIRDSLGDNDALFLKADREDWFVVLPQSTWFKLLGGE